MGSEGMTGPGFPSAGVRCRAEIRIVIRVLDAFVNSAHLHIQGATQRLLEAVTPRSPEHEHCHHGASWVRRELA